MMMIMKASTIISIWILSFLMMVMLCLTGTGTASTTMYSFAVDQSGLVYVGHEKKISVYDQGVEIRSIVPQTSRGYEFTIDENDNIILAAAGTVYKMDLQGKILLKWKDYGNKMYDEIHHKFNRYTSANGTQYVVRYPFARTQIESEDKVVWKMPLSDYAVRWLKILIGIGLPIVVFREILPVARGFAKTDRTGDDSVSLPIRGRFHD